MVRPNKDRPMNAFTPLAADPTKATYLSLVQSYDYLNAELWSGKLPPCLVTLQRKANCRGYFAGDRFVTRNGEHKADEIALNPKRSQVLRLVAMLLRDDVSRAPALRFDAQRFRIRVNRSVVRAKVA